MFAPSLPPLKTLTGFAVFSTETTMKRTVIVRRNIFSLSFQHPVIIMLRGGHKPPLFVASLPSHHGREVSLTPQ